MGYLLTGQWIQWWILKFKECRRTIGMFSIAIIDDLTGDLLESGWKEEDKRWKCWGSIWKLNKPCFQMRRV